MAALAISLCVLYVVVLFGVRAAVQRHATGSTGWVRAATPVEHRANVLVFAAWLLALLGPALVICGALRPIGALDSAGAHALGVALLGASLGLAVLAQRTMGAAWRTGIDPTRPSPLVTSGLFGLVRNPVYTTMLATSLGVALLVPTWAGAASFVVCLAGLEIQTRFVEEPHLCALHGERYKRYARRVGRLLPGVGRLRQKPSR
jgi:protein-S-isoprenylcysteine O-methyltransferase Ste14